MITFTVTLLVTILVRVPVGFCLLLSSFAYMITTDTLVMGMMTSRLVAGADRFTLLAIPFFIFAGKCMNESGITARIFELAKTLVGHIPGGLAHANLLASIFFAGMSGAAVADAGGLGTVEIEAMKKDGYDIGFSAAVTAASSTIGPIIPPSIPIIIFGVFSGTSVAALFAAGFIPGLLMALAMMILIYYYAVRRKYPKHPRTTLKNLAIVTFQAIPPLLTPVILVGGILGGVFTPTEAGAVAALYSLFLGLFFYRTLTWRKVIDVLEDSAFTTATVMLIVMAAAMFGYVLTIERIPVIASEFLMNLTQNKILVLMIINIFSD